MKVFILSLLLFLSGCGSLATDKMFKSNLLDTAPKNDAEVRYPDWRLAPASLMAAKPESMPATHQPMKTLSDSSLESFLSANGLDYELIPGDHTMVKLKRAVQFQTGSAVVPSASVQWLAQLGRYLANTPQIDIVIEGHTDNTGTERFNDGLSMRRADMVKNILLEQQVSLAAIYTRGYGEHTPACTNQTSQGRACNRRVEVLMIMDSQ